MDFSQDLENYFDEMKATIERIDPGQVQSAMDAILDAYRMNSTVYIFGNGGSASTASHIVCDFNKGISLGLDNKFNFICLNDNIATMMAISNDVSYDQVFSVPLVGGLKEGDLVFGISGSGNSKNVINAVEYAKSRGNKVISLTGYDGGKLNGLSDYPIHVPIKDMQKAEDSHMMILHAMAQVLAKHLGNPMC